MCPDHTPAPADQPGQDFGARVLGRVIRPSHTPWDGDVAFALSTGRGPPAPLPLLAILAQEAVAEAVVIIPLRCS